MNTTNDINATLAEFKELTEEIARVELRISVLMARCIADSTGAGTTTTTSGAHSTEAGTAAANSGGTKEKVAHDGPPSTEKQQ